MTLHHQKQPERFGCLYHALYAITGDERALQYTEDISELRFHARAVQLGYLLLPLYVCDAPLGGRFGMGWWDALRARVPAAEPLPVMVSIEQRHDPRVHHVVALCLRHDGPVTVSDSSADTFLTLDWHTFQASPYARAFRVEGIGTTDVDAYPYESARERLTQLDRERHPDLTL